MFECFECLSVCVFERFERLSERLSERLRECFGCFARLSVLSV